MSKDYLCDRVENSDRVNDNIAILLNAATAKISQNNTPKKDPDLTHFCIDCGEVIPRKRIEAAPHTERCVECQNRFELKGPIDLDEYDPDDDL